jgi:hypothetical protein
LKSNKILVLVGGERVEPSHLAVHDFESCASTIPPPALVSRITGVIVLYSVKH